MPKARIIKAENLSPSVKLYTCQALSRGFSFLPGQFFTFLPVLRAYSFCSLPEELPQFEICVRDEGPGLGVNFLKNNLGRAVAVSEPQGSFVLPAQQTELTFIAAGVGIAPVRPMLRAWFEKYPDAKATLYYKSRLGENLFGEEFKELADKHPLSISRDFPAARNSQVFVVGSPEFVTSSIRKLEEIGYNKADINFDIW